MYRKILRPFASNRQSSFACSHDCRRIVVANVAGQTSEHLIETSIFGL